MRTLIPSVNRRSFPVTSLALAALLWGATAFAQTPVKLPKNKFTPKQDVEIGREAAAEVRKQYPIIKDERLVRYLAGLGNRLVAAAPPDLKQPVYEYSFTPVNLKEINAFALPGGPMFVNRGMVEAAADESEVAGVMAHELAHVLLRHGTANVTKAQNPWLQLGQIAGIVGGAVVGGGAGAAIAQGSQFGLGTVLLKYSREFEKQADLVGVQIMARAGYDPRALAHLFEAIAAKSKDAPPQWLSSHPNPENRTQYINKEASLVTMGPPADTSGFKPAKSMLASLPPAKTTADVERAAAGAGASGAAPGAEAAGTVGEPVPAPSAQYREIKGGNVFRAAVPSNWTAISSKSAVKVVPPNGYGDYNGQTVFSHGVEFGVLKTSSRQLAAATNECIEALAGGNPDLRVAGAQQATRISDRSALATPLVNPSPLGGQERLVVHTTFLADGTLFYYLTIVQEKDAPAYQEAFRRVGESIRLADGR